MKISIILEALTGTFETDIKRASKEAEKAAKETREAWKQAGIVIGTAAAAGVSALAALTKQAINTADQYSKMAQKVGISTEAISTLGYAAARSDVDLTKLQGGLVKLAKNASDAAAGTGEARIAFEALGISVKDTDGRLKTTEQLLLEVSNEFAGMENSAQKTALAVQVFGRAGADLLPLLNSGADGIAELQQAARDLGLEVDNTTGKLAEEFNDRLADLGSLAQGLGNDIARELLPSLTQLATQAVENGKQMRGASGAVEGFANGLKVLLAVAFATKEAVATLTAGIAATVDVATTGVGILNSLNNLRLGRATAEDILRLSTATDDLANTASNAADAFRGQFDESVRSFSDTLSALFDPLNNTTTGLNETGEAADKKAAPGLKNAAEEAKKFAEELKKLKKAQDDAVGVTSDMVDELEGWQRQTDDLIGSLEMELRMLGMTNAEREEAIALSQLGANATAEEIARVRELIGELQREAEIRAAAEAFQSIWLDAANSVGDALTTALFDGAESGADAIMDVMEQLARDLVRFWLQQQIVIPLQQQMMGGTAQGGGFNMQQLMGMFGGGNSATLGGNTQWGAFGPGSSAWTFGSGSTNTAFGSSIFGDSAGQWFGGNTGWAAAGNVLGAVGGIYGVYDTWRNGPGGAEGALSGAMSGAAAGTAIMPGIGTAVGAIIGALAGWFGGEDFDDPRLRVVSSGDIGRNVERGSSGIGSFIVNAEQIQGGRQLEEQVVQALGEFDAAFMQLLQTMGVGQEQFARIQEAADAWSFDIRGTAFSIEDILTDRFTALVDTFGEDVAAFVGDAEGLEARMTALADAIFIDAAAEAGYLADTFGEVADILMEFRNEGEALADTYVRVMASTEMLTQALDIAGIALDIGEEAFRELAVGITEAAGGLQQAQSLWASFFETFYTDAERAASIVEQATAMATAEFADIGVALDQFTGSDGLARFRALFESVLPSLTADQVVAWLEAARALGILTEATAQFAQYVEDVGNALAPGTRPGGSAVFNPDAEIVPGGGVQAPPLSGWNPFDQWFRDIDRENGGFNLPGLDDLPDTIDRTVDALNRWIETLDELQRDLLTDETLSTLTPAERLAEIERQYQQAFTGALAGDQASRDLFDQIARQFAEVGRDFFGSSEGYTDIFTRILADIGLLRSTAGAPISTSPAVDNLVGSNVGTTSAQGSAAIVERLDAMLARQEMLETRVASIQNAAVRTAVATETTALNTEAQQERTYG